MSSLEEIVKKYDLKSAYEAKMTDGSLCKTYFRNCTFNEDVVYFIKFYEGIEEFELQYIIDRSIFKITSGTIGNYTNDKHLENKLRKFEETLLTYYRGL